MKKIIYRTFILIALISALALNVSATNNIDFDSLESDVRSSLTSAIDGDTLDVLSDIGIDNFSFDEIYNISFKNISSFFKDTLTDKLSSVSKDISGLFCIIMVAGIISALFKDYSDENFTSMLCVVIISVITINIINNTLNAVVSVLDLSGNFMAGFAPVYTLIISLSGNAASALTYNTFAVILAEVISAFISGGIINIVGLYFCLGISFTLNESINISRFNSIVNRSVSISLGLAGSAFTGFLSFKNILSVSVDRVSVRSVRFLISSLIPIVGSSISDAYSSLIGSINLIKSSVAIVGILVIIIINTPIIIETLVYYISFNLLSYLSDSLSVNRVGDVFRVFAGGIRILLLTCIFEVFILIITTGIVLSVKSGG